MASIQDQLGAIDAEFRPAPAISFEFMPDGWSPGPGPTWAPGFPPEYEWVVFAAGEVRRLRRKFTVTDLQLWEADHGRVCEGNDYGQCHHRIWRRMSMRLNGVKVKYIWRPGMHSWKRTY